MTNPLLRLEKLDVYYENFRAVHSVEMEFCADEIVCVIGANGAGKSSVLNAIIGQAGRTAGRVMFDDIDISSLPTPRRIARGLSLVPEGRRLFPSLSVEDNLKIGLFTGRKGGIGLRGIYDIFPVLEEKARQRASGLSGGQQQMIAIGRSLLTNPRLVLFDEISLGLSPLVIRDIYSVLPRIRANGTGIVIVEQDITRSLGIADRFYCLLEGKVTLAGRPRDVSRETVTSHYFGAHP